MVGRYQTQDGREAPGRNQIRNAGRRAACMHRLHRGGIPCRSARRVPSAREAASRISSSACESDESTALRIWSTRWGTGWAGEGGRAR